MCGSLVISCGPALFRDPLPAGWLRDLLGRGLDDIGAHSGGFKEAIYLLVKRLREAARMLKGAEQGRLLGEYLTLI